MDPSTPTATHTWVKTEQDALGHHFVYWTCDRCGGMAFHEVMLDALPCVPKAEQMRQINEREHEPVTVTSLIKTCDALPSQWEGLTDTRQCIYIRYRSGHGRIGLGETMNAAIDDNNTFIWFGEHPLDGYITLDQVRKLAPPWLTIPTDINDGWDDETQRLLAERDV